VNLCWLFGHRKEYVGVEAVVWTGPYGDLPRPCVHGYTFLNHCDVCGKSSQVARWYCPCGEMGQTFIPIGKGLYRVYMGQLVPDEKAWANLKLYTREES
jgi:hypothetical protein